MSGPESASSIHANTSLMWVPGTDNRDGTLGLCLIVSAPFTEYSFMMDASAALDFMDAFAEQGKLVASQIIERNKLNEHGIVVADATTLDTLLKGPGHGQHPHA